MSFGQGPGQEKDFGAFGLCVCLENDFNEFANYVYRKRNRKLRAKLF